MPSLPAHPPLYIDADSILNRDFLRWLFTHYGNKYLSVIAYVEAGLYYAGRDGGCEDEDDVEFRLQRFDDTLKRAGVLVVPLHRVDVRHAVKSGVLAAPDLPWDKHKMDHLIASLAAIPPRVIVTKNKRDFEHLIQPDRIMGPYDVINRWH